MTRAYNIVRKWYISVLLIYLSARNVPFLSSVVASGLWTMGAFGIGVLLALYQIFRNPKCLAAPQIDFMLLFFLATCLSCYMNARYGYAENIKVLAMMVLFFLFWFPLGADKNERDGLMRHIAATLSCIWFVLCVLSVGMFLFAIDYEVVGGVWGQTNQGFSGRYMRLWGVFHDPNYAGAGCVAAIFACLYLRATIKKTWISVACWVNIAFQLIYIGLSGSRSTLIALLCAMAVYVPYQLAGGKGEKSTWIDKGRKAAISVIGVACCYALVQLSCYVMPYVQNVCRDLPRGVVNSVCRSYNAMYKWSDTEFLSQKTLATELEMLANAKPDDNQQNNPTNTEAQLTTPAPTVDPGQNTQPTTPVATTPAPVNTTTAPVVTAPPAVDRTDGNKPENDISNGRFMRWSHMIQIFKSSPIYGTSPKNLVPFARDHNSDTLMSKFRIAGHNSYLEVLTSTGLIGTVAMLMLMISILIPIIRKYFLFDKDQTFILAAMICLEQALVGIFISDLFFLFSIGSNLLWMSVGMAVHSAPESKRVSCVYWVISKVSKLIKVIRHG